MANLSQSQLAELQALAAAAVGRRSAGMAKLRRLMRGAGPRRQWPDRTTAAHQEVRTGRVRALLVLTYGKGIDVLPSISPDGSKTAASAASESRGSRWRYDLVVIDNTTRRALASVVPAIDETLSQPKFINDREVAFIAFNERVYTLKLFDVQSRRDAVLGQISVGELRVTNVIEIKAATSVN